MLIAIAFRMQQYINTLAHQIRQESHLTAVGIAVAQADQPIQLAVSGVRRHKHPTPVQTTDQWHIGSITKSITGTMVGILVDEGALAFDDKLPALLPDIPMQAQWAECSMEHLLTHTAGLPANFSIKTRKMNPTTTAELIAARRELIQHVLDRPPKAPCGSAFRYSNVGYTIVGHILETLTHTSYEALIEKRLFQASGLKSAGFGPPKGETPDDQPMGHHALLWYRKAADPFKGMADNSPIISAAGRAHMSLSDLVNYGRMHLDGRRGSNHLLKTDTWRKLHKPTSKDDYACGWVNTDTEKHGTVIWHNGSNTLWYALLTLNLDKNTAIAMVTNHGAIHRADKTFRLAGIQITDSLE